MQNQSVNWPAILKHAGDPELDYISDQAEWDANADLHAAGCDASDYLIDASGNTFSLARRINNRIEPQASGDTKTLAEILGLVKAHAAQSGSCCVAKLYAPSISAAFEIVKSVDADR